MGNGGGSNAPVAVANWTTTECSGAPTTCAATISTGTIPAGDLSVVTVAAYDSVSEPGGGTIALADDAGSTYTQLSSSPVDILSHAGHWIRLRSFYTCSTGGSAGTKVTATSSGGAANFLFVSGRIYSYTGTCHPDANNFGACSSGGCSATSVTTSSIITGFANETLVVGCVQWDGGTWSGGSDGHSGTFTVRTQDNFMATADITESSAATYSATMNFGDTTQGSCILSAYYGQ